MTKKFTSFFILLFIIGQVFSQPQGLIKKGVLGNPGGRQIQNQDNIPVPTHRTCGTMDADSALRANNPTLGSLQDFENWLKKKISANKDSLAKMPPVYNIPVIVHVINNGEAVGSGSNISQAQINSQFDVFNEDFRKLNADYANTPSVFKPFSADPEIQFCKAAIDPNGNVLAQPGIDRINRTTKGFSAPPYSQTYIDGTIKPATSWDPTKYFNIWVLNLGNSLLGYAQFPSNSGLGGLSTNGGAANTDGIVILYTSFGRVGNVSAPYNKGRTATHETGHWLGLRHIWGDGTCATDYCNDTPTQQTSNYGCPSFPHVTCSNGPNGDMFMNYMDYTDDPCMSMFSNDQRTRMRTVMVNCPRRMELNNSTVCNTNSPPVCGFTANSFTVTVGGTINFIDQSGGTPTSWNWTFQGASPSSSSQQNPSGVVYSAAGVFNATLIATNSFGTCTLTQVVSVIPNVGCDTLNYPPPGAIVTYTGGGGFICGWNTTYKDISKADYFASYSPYTHITGGLIYFRSAYRSSGSSATVSFRVWDNTGAGGKPGTVLGFKTITLQTLDAAIPAGGAIYKIIFDSPIQVTTPFYFGISMNNFANADSLGIRSNTNGDSNPNTAWEQWSDNAWHAFNESNSWGISISQFISPFMTNLPPNANLTADDLSGCVGAAINFNGTSSINETSYSWSFPGGNPASSISASQSVTYNSVGTFKAILTVTGTCQGSDKDSISSIVINPGPTVNPIATNVSCSGGNNGSASAIPSSGSSPFSYNWSNGQTAQTATGLSAGTYTVTVIDNNSCSSSASIVVSQPSQLTVSVSSTNSSCSGSNGTANAVPSGGNSPYNFLWSNGQSSANLSGLSAGTYTVTVTDNSGCTQTGSAVISSSGGGLSSTNSVINVSCNGGNNGSATATPGGGTSPYNYSWNTNPPQSTSTATGLSAGNFTVTISDINNCSVVSSLSITQPSALVINPSKTDNTCGNSNGTATASVSGGVSPYSYSWSNGQTSSTATGLAAGNYTVTVIDANNCSSTSNFSLIGANGPALTTTSTNVSCNGANNGTATVNATGGTSPLNYNWSNGGTSQTISNLAPGNYSITVTDANSCSSVTTVNITQPALLNSSGTSVNASCNGICDGAVSAIASGGTSPYNFSWNGGLGTGQSISSVCAGNYSVTITDSKNCTSISTTVVNQPTAIIITTSSTQALCGSANGTATASGSGGAGGFSFLWSNGQTGSTATGLVAGTYSVTVTDNTGCKATKNVSVSNNIPTTLSISSTNVSCSGGNNGNATAIPGGGTLPYTYSWSNGGSAATINSLFAGTYTVTVSDATNCTVIKSVVISEPLIISLNPVSVNVDCFGKNNGSATVNPSGGVSPFSFSWSNGTNQSGIDSLSPGNYSVTVTDGNNCQALNSFSISEPGILSSSVNSTPSSCNGICDGSLSASASGGTSPYSYSWSGGLGTGAVKSSVCPGNYSVTITDNNNCNLVSNSNVSQPTAIVLSLNAANATCGVSNGSASVNASGGGGGFTFLWNTGSTNNAITGLSAGTFSITVTDINNCKNNASIVVLNPGAPVITTGGANPSCNGLCNGSAIASVTGGNLPYTFQWSNGQTNSTATSLCSGNYSVTVTDSTNCIASTSGSLTQPPVLNSSFSVNNNPCLISATVNATGGTPGYSYLWSNGQNSQTSSGLSSGSYSVTVTDINNCIVADSVVITGNPANIVSTAIVVNASCFNGNNGSATVTPSGGTSPYSINWSNGQTSTTASGLISGTYFFTATDANGCFGKDSVKITQPLQLNTILTATGISCNGGNDGSVSASVSGGVSTYSFQWSNGAGTPQISNLTAQTYSLTVTDFNGCITTGSTSVTEPLPILLSTSSTPESCGLNNGTGTINVSGGTSPYTFQWPASAGSQTGQTATGLNGGVSVSYTVLILDAAGCFKNTSVSVGGSSAVTGTISSTEANCGANDGSATINPGGGTPPYDYLWNNGDTTGGITGIPAGNYSVTITDNSGCTFISSVVVDSKPGLIISAASSPSQCGSNDGLATVTILGGVTPYFYFWSNGDSTPTADSLYSGNYSVTVNDVNGCSDSAIVVVGGLSTMNLNLVVSNENCGKSDGVIIAGVSGGTDPYSYQWSDSFAQTGQIALGLKEGVYSLTVTDSDNCTKVSTVNLLNTSSLSINVLQTAGGHCGSNNGTVASSAQGGPQPYTWLWSNGDTTSTATGMVAGTYGVTITDAAGCKVASSIFVGSTPMTVTDSVKGETCDGKKDGNIDISVIGGVAPYSFKWSNEATSEDLNNISAGSYFLVVSDANGCPVKDTIIVGILEETGCLDIPTGFTPNGDGKNDTWKIKGIGNYPEINVEIFNRWGSVIFTSKGYAQPWDGTSNGRELPSAAYYYIISLGEGSNKTGSVTIIR